MDDATITILAVAGVASVLIFVVKGLLDQVPDVIASIKKIRDAWRRFKQGDAPPPLPRQEGEPDLDREDDNEPSAAA
ncbi:hypothetical protein GCM10010420_10700 [Streptomyces glaucosporus]|uniref:Secreted protein n=1 Tax=Streptomyces glaucosporus TaxID=284044 RepID=A0ABP5UX20_9ACTN